MRQTFEVTGGPSLGQQNLPLLRAQMKAQNLDAYYIPHEDAYQNEYLPAAFDRLTWATGFTGSAGAAIVLENTAVVFVDGRYTLQAAQQLDADLFQQESLDKLGPFKWLSQQELNGKRIGVDLHLVGQNAFEELADCAKLAGAEIVPVTKNPIDEAWTNQPPEPKQPVVPHDIRYAGEAFKDKLKRVGASIASAGADAAIITSPASIAWVFNIRGGDVQCSPLPLGRAILHADGSADLFLHQEKVSEELKPHLDGINILPMDQLAENIAKLQNKSVSLDPNLASAWFFKTVTEAGAKIVIQADPCALPRACKNEVEIAGSQQAHLRDGAAMTRFLRWLDSEEVQSGTVNEIQAAQKLEFYREELQGLKDLSFETISGAGSNGAHCHYRVNEATVKVLEKNSLYLVDSGGQYLDGTTDITRTVAIGEPTQEMKERYTIVLKGHIALARLRFPKGTTGSAIDAIARQPMWALGLDYEHGTGHGVGSYLGVHEGPQRISKLPNFVGLEPGMIVSNEPGYYKEGGYGIRIENLQFVTQPRDITGGDIPMMEFEALTLAPLCTRLIESGMLTPDEWIWVDRYHQRVLKELSPLLAGDDLEWLKDACKEL
ncbi:aminopeptidase P family protein [Hirschia maritima]|uniref:aminopeptidase P family protein n=1 Tax=Hirschia maritima TaxID=1121961 RepID=UPI000371840B|nr:aminopeptidase P family protein [Hirschia maritima]